MLSEISYVLPEITEITLEITDITLEITEIRNKCQKIMLYFGFTYHVISILLIMYKHLS